MTPGSVDPDGDKLTYSLAAAYRRAGTYRVQKTSCRRDDDKAASLLTVPADAKPGDTIHLIAEVTDSGKPPLTRYARVIVTVKGK